MKIKTEIKHNRIELSIDDRERVLFKQDSVEIYKLINNLLDVIDDLAFYVDKSVSECVEYFGYGDDANDND